MISTRFFFPLLLAARLSPSSGAAETLYQKPPKEVLDVLHAPALPDASLDPTRTTLLLATPVRFPPIADLAQPFLRLGGSRVVVRNRSLYAAPYSSAFDLVRIADGSVTHVALPAGAKAGSPSWSPDGKRYAFSVIGSDAVELWLGEAASGKVHRIPGAKLNPFFRDEITWMPDGQTLLVQLVPREQGQPPAALSAPTGPDVKETSGGKASSTYEVRDVLTSEHDEALFDYYASTQLARVDASGRVTAIGKPAVHLGASPSPDGHLLVQTLHRPWSRLTTWDRFPREVDVWDRDGKQVHHIASVPLSESVPIWGVPIGPREFEWRPDAPSTLVWAEALDGGDWKTQVPNRDRVMSWKAPFEGEATEVLRTEQRFSGIAWLEGSGRAFLTDVDLIRHWTRVFVVDFDAPGSSPRKIQDRSTDERYRNPGSPVLRTLANGFSVVEHDGDTIWLRGQGASPEGDRPFLDRDGLCHAPLAHPTVRGCLGRGPVADRAG